MLAIAFEERRSKERGTDNNYQFGSIKVKSNSAPYENQKKVEEKRGDTGWKRRQERSGLLRRVGQTESDKEERIDLQS